MIPEISIVIPLYNKKTYIKKTIDSVLNQSIQSFECIIVDSSDDGSTDVVKQYTDFRIQHIVQNSRTLVSKARNIGIEHAKSDIIAFLDADDEWTPYHLEALVRLHTNFPDAALIFTPYIKLLPNGRPVNMVFAELPKPPWEGNITNYFRIASRGDIPICSSNCAVKKEILKLYGGFDENLCYGEDQYLWGRIALEYPISFSWKGPAIYHTEAIGRSCNNPHEMNEDPLSVYLEKYIRENEISDKLQSDVIRYIKRKRKTILFAHVIKGNMFSSGKNVSKKSDIFQNINFQSSGFKKITRTVSYLFLNLYHSRIYNEYRKIRCFFHNWYVPRLND